MLFGVFLGMLLGMLFGMFFGGGFGMLYCRLCLVYLKFLTLLFLMQRNSSMLGVVAYVCLRFTVVCCGLLSCAAVRRGGLVCCGWFWCVGRCG